MITIVVQIILIHSTIKQKHDVELLILTINIVLE